MTDDDLQALEFQILDGPAVAPVVRGTGGLRKTRFAPSKWKQGKSGAIRVGYVYFQDFGIVLLLLAYAKSAKDDLTPDDKKTIRTLIDAIRTAFETRTIK